MRRTYLENRGAFAGKELSDGLVDGELFDAGLVIGSVVFRTFEGLELLEFEFDAKAAHRVSTLGEETGLSRSSVEMIGAFQTFYFRHYIN